MQEVKDWVKRIEEAKGDPEIAHGLEDDLRAEFLQFIASKECQDLDQLKNMARVIKRTRLIDFPRWTV